MRGLICLCGSTRFREQFDEVNRRLTWSGWVVLSVGSFHHSEKDHSIADQIIKRKVKLDILHKEKIDLSWAIVVINVGGYMGESTKSELAHARARGKEVFWYDISSEDVPTFSDSWTMLLDESPDDLLASTISERPDL